MYLVVGFPFHPVARGQSSEKEFSDFVIGEDKDRERNSREPPPELQGVHPETLVHTRSVGKEGS